MPKYDPTEAKNDYVKGEDGKLKAYTKTPSTLDYFKEAFSPTSEKAQLEAIRNARERAKGSS